MECKSCLLSFSRKSKLRFTRRRPLKRAAESSRQCLPRRQAANHVAPPPPGGVCLLAQASAPVLPCVKSFLFATLFLRARDWHGFRAKSNPQLIYMAALGLGACHVERSASIPPPLPASQSLPPR